MFRRLLVVSAAVLFTTVATTAFAAEERAAETLAPASLVLAPVVAEAAPFTVHMPVAPVFTKKASHVGAQVGMGAVYASTALMHILDIDSTLKALKVGAVEANPMMSGVVHNKAAFFATKAAIATASIYATARMARHNKLGAIITSSAINSAYLMIVRNNYKIAGR